MLIQTSYIKLNIQVVWYIRDAAPAWTTLNFTTEICAQKAHLFHRRSTIGNSLFQCLISDFTHLVQQKLSIRIIDLCPILIYSILHI